MDTKTLDTVLTILHKESKNWHVPIVTLVAERSNDPFQVLISTMLSLRTKDETTTEASRKLFARADTPQKMIALSAKEISQLIFPVGFYKTKSESILKTCRIILGQHDGRVPDDMDGLLALPGVGRKTANLVLTLGFGKPGVLHGSFSYLLQDRNGQVRETHSVSAGLDYPGVGPEHRFLKDSKRVTYASASDKEAIAAYEELSRTEGIIPALEPAHALAFAKKLSRKMPRKSIMIINLSGRGDKDIETFEEFRKAGS